VLDVLIRGGWVVDGTGNPAFPADVAIDDGRILEVGRLDEGATAGRVVDATGKTVCPGFVDPHSHSDFTVLTNPTAESTIRQGVTTEIVGNCGWSYAPVTDHSAAMMLGRLRTFAYEGPIEWSTTGEFLELVERIGHAQNLAWFVGHNAVRLAAGVSGPEPSEEGLRTMEGMVREAMDAGVLGMSTGLEFEPGRAAPTEELIRLNAVAGGYEGAIYTSHIRNRDATLLSSIEEFLEIARAGGTKAEISHLNVRHNTGAPDRGWERAVELMAEGRDHGLDVLADTTPLRDGLGQMAAILPPWVMEGGAAAAAERLRQPSIRRRLRGECDRYWRFIHQGEWDRVRLQMSNEYPGLEGMSFPEIARALGKDEWECFFDILAAEGEAMESVLMVGRLFTDEHLAEMIGHPLFCLGVDTFTSTVDGPLSQVAKHPLAFSGHVHYLTHHVRELGTLRLEEAIRKMTSMPAAHFGLHDRGLLLPGFAADVVVFDFEGLDDVSTDEDPLAYAHGVEHVLVNGVAVIESGIHSGARPGRRLLRR
jgi:N-acyl-D-amino-acid deacylase